MNLDKFKGVFCALNAIYDENDNIDVEKIKALVRVYKSLGVKGVYACGSTGEGFLLSTEERKQVAKAVKEAAGDDFTVIVHIGCASTKESIELAKDCESLGVDAISAVPCVYYHLSEESVKLHWNSIIESTSLPFIIYNIPPSNPTSPLKPTGQNFIAYISPYEMPASFRISRMYNCGNTL